MYYFLTGFGWVSVNRTGWYIDLLDSCILTACQSSHFKQPQIKIILNDCNPTAAASFVSRTSPSSRKSPVFFCSSLLYFCHAQDQLVLLMPCKLCTESLVVLSADTSCFLRPADCSPIIRLFLPPWWASLAKLHSGNEMLSI